MPVKPTFVTGSAYELPFTNETFDVVVISDVLEHLHDLQLTVKEISRVLKPNGILVFDTISRTLYSYLFIWLGAQQILGLFPRDAHDWRMFITPEEMVILLQSHAFTIGSDWQGIEFVLDPLAIVGAIFGKSSLVSLISEVKLTPSLYGSYAGWARK
eukprot:m.56732 g.56732  ORF g.56732 m.56732 type:complete len:157 (+) comp11058_c0_seq2:670-1140(+)